MKIMVSWVESREKLPSSLRVYLLARVHPVIAIRLFGGVAISHLVYSFFWTLLKPVFEIASSFLLAMTGIASLLAITGYKRRAYSQWRLSSLRAQRSNLIFSLYYLIKAMFEIAALRSQWRKCDDEDYLPFHSYLLRQIKPIRINW